jgi:hypothetical protein
MYLIRIIIGIVILSALLGCIWEYMWSIVWIPDYGKKLREHLSVTVIIILILVGISRIFPEWW